MEKELDIENNKNSNSNSPINKKETQQRQYKTSSGRNHEKINNDSSIKDYSQEKSVISFLKQSENFMLDNKSEKIYNKNNEKVSFKYSKKNIEYKSEKNLDKEISRKFFMESPVYLNDFNKLKNDLQNNPNIIKKNSFDDNSLDIRTEINKINPQKSKNKQKEKNEINNSKIYNQHKIFVKKYKIFVILFILGIILNSSSYCLSLYLQLYGNKVAFICFCAVTILIVIFYLLGIVAVNQDKQFINSIIKKKDDPEKIFQSRQRKNVFLFLYTLILSFNYQLIILTENTVFINDIKMSIRGRGYNILLWMNYFQNKNYSDIIASFQKIFIAYLVLSWISVTLSLFTIIYIFYFLKNYRTFKSLIQIFCLLIIQSSLFQIYYGKYCQNFIKITSLDDVTYSWVTPGEITIGVIGFFIGIYGFYIFFTENKKHSFYFNFMCIGLFILSIVFSSGLRGLNSKFKNYKFSSCNSLFKFISEDSLVYKNSDCYNKYLFTTESLDSIQCPKERIMVNWELTENINNTKNVDSEHNLKFGCIDQSCCLQTYFNIKIKFNYLEIISFYQIIQVIILVLSGIYMYKNIDTEKTLKEEILDKIGNWILICFCILLFGIVSILFSLQKNYPKQSELNEIKNNKVNDNSTLINKKQVIPTEKNKLIETTNEIFQKKLKEVINNYENNLYFYLNDSDCNFNLLYFDFYLNSDSLNILYKDDLSINANYFNFTNNTYKNKTQIINFKSKTNIINNFLKYFDFEIINPIKPVNNLTITIDVIFKKKNFTKEIDEKNKIIEFQNLYGIISNKIIITEENISLCYNENTNLSKINLLKDIKLNFSIINKKYFFYIIGNILDDEGDSFINIHNYYFGQENLIYSVKSNNDGNFILGPLYPLLNSEIFELNIEIYKIIKNPNDTSNFTKNDYYHQYNEIIKIGGIDYFGYYFSFHRIKNVLLPKKISKNYIISGSVYETKNDDDYKTLSSVHVKIYKGNYTYLMNEIIENIKIGNNDDYYLAQAISDKDGDFSFNVDSNGYYFLIYEKTNYFIETQKIFINETSENNIKINKMELIKIFNAGKIMVKLEWESKPNDLDLICRFKVSEKDYCYTFFGNERCVETSFYTDAKNGEGKYSEIIEVEEFSDYMYLFYVRKYYDESNGEAKNERKINGVDMNRNLNFTDLYKNNNETLVNSNAKLLIYSNGLKYSTIRIDINDHINENLSIENSYKEEDNKGIYWVGFCINGKEGINSIKIINKISKIEPAKNICSIYYDQMNKTESA